MLSTLVVLDLMRVLGAQLQHQFACARQAIMRTSVVPPLAPIAGLRLLVCLTTIVLQTLNPKI